jgi:hypothetical protein
MKEGGAEENKTKLKPEKLNIMFRNILMQKL